MTYDEARTYIEEANELRRLIYEEGLLEATVRVYVSHEESKDDLAGVLAFEVESDDWCIDLKCKVCEEKVEAGHTCIDGAISEKQLRKLRRLFPGWKWPRKAGKAS